ncbi:MAG: type II toxin-antitoxin system RelE/ParE family toxin [Ginsengibacter sp.]
MVREVIWPRSVQNQLTKAYQYILKDSFQNAEKVKEDILKSTRKLTLNPEIYPIDKYRKNKMALFVPMSCIVIGLLTG